MKRKLFTLIINNEWVNPAKNAFRELYWLMNKRKTIRALAK